MESAPTTPYVGIGTRAPSAGDVTRLQSAEARSGSSRTLIIAKEYVTCTCKHYNITVYEVCIGAIWRSINMLHVQLRRGEGGLKRRGEGSIYMGVTGSKNK